MEEHEVLVDEGKRKEIFATAALTPGLLIRLAWEKKCFLRPPPLPLRFPTSGGGKKCETENCAAISRRGIAPHFHAHAAVWRLCHLR